MFSGLTSCPTPAGVEGFDQVTERYQIPQNDCKVLAHITCVQL